MEMQPNTSASGCPSQNDDNCLILKWIITIAAPLLLVTGTVGNVFAFSVMLSKKFREKPSSICLMFLLLSDLIQLWLIVPVSSWVTLFGNDLFTKHVCLPFFICITSSQAISLFLMAFISIERVISICYPFKARYIVTKINAICAIVIMIVSVIILHILQMLSFESDDQIYNLTVVKPTWKSSCVVEAQRDINASIYRQTLLIGVNYTVPVLLISVSNGIIVRKLFVQFNATSSISQTVSRVALMSNVTRAVIVLSVFYFLTSTPYIVFRIYIINFNKTDSSAIDLYEAIFYFLLFFNHTCNFLLYYWTGSEFRSECRKMYSDIFACCFQRRPASLSWYDR